MTGKSCITCKHHGEAHVYTCSTCDIHNSKWEFEEDDYGVTTEVIPKCDTCKHYDTDCLTTAGLCTTINSKWEPVVAKEANSNKSGTELSNPFKTQVGGEHYQLPIDLAELLIKDKVGYPEGAVMKYAFRHANKNGIEDLRKAKHYLEMIAFCVYNENL